eukprot:300936-Chlamydomonas_euryale.AAC.2
MPTPPQLTRYIQLRGIEMSQPACCSSAADRALARACHVAASLRSRCLGSARHAACGSAAEAALGRSAL